MSAVTETEAPLETTAQDAIRRDRAKRKRPYELQALIDFVVGSDADDRAADGLYHRFGVDRQWWHRHKKSGLTFWEADRLATRIGEWAAFIWPEWESDDGTVKKEKVVVAA